MNICIFANGGSTIGMGHVMRTLVLAKELCKENKVSYICKKGDKYKSGIDKIKKEGFEVIELDENRVKDEIKNISADCIITDSYDVDEEYFNILKQNFKLSAYIDDINICKYFNVDILINPNIYAKKLDYKVNSTCKLLLGSDYVLLRDEFRKICNTKKKINNSIDRVMITLGGSDNNNITESIIKELMSTEYELNVVVGAGFKYADTLLKYENNKIKIHFNADMLKLMSECDVAISSCGTTLYELAACGTPTLGLVVADNQVLAANTMDRLGIIKKTQLQKISYDLLSLSYDKRVSMSSIGQGLVDGKGAKRIAINLC